MDIGTIRKLDNAAANVDVALNKRAFSDGIPLVKYANLRVADVKRLLSFEINEESIRGNLLTSKTKKQQRQQWPRACPRMGIAWCTDWVQPLLDLRHAYAKVNGRPTH